MPAYPWLARRDASQAGDIAAKMRALSRLGHPYSDAEIESASSQLDGVKEIDALIAYLQMLGTGLSEEVGP